MDRRSAEEERVSGDPGPAAIDFVYPPDYVPSVGFQH